MAPSAAQQDHYRVLGVSRDASSEVIKQVYRKLALRLHPDRNHGHGAKEAFQKIAEAHETLADDCKRRAYDVRYLSNDETTKSPSQGYHSSSSTSQASASSQGKELSEAAEIASLQKSRSERLGRWRISRAAFESTICRIRKEMELLEREIGILKSVETAEAAVEAWERSWTMWLLSPVYKKLALGEDDRARNDRARQERKMQKNLKERILDAKKTALDREESSLHKAKRDFETANSGDDRRLRVIAGRISERRTREALAARAAEEERVEKLRRQQAAQQRELERRQREIIEQEELRRHHERFAHTAFPEYGRRQTHTSICRHEGWWPKAQGRRACPKCGDIWTYLLECPSCQTRACPKCQHGMRSRNWSSDFNCGPDVEFW